MQHKVQFLLFSLFLRDFAQKLANALSHNPTSGLHTINLANNPLEDRGTVTLSFPAHNTSPIRGLVFFFQFFLKSNNIMDSITAL